MIVKSLSLLICAFASTSLAVGSITVKNNCPSPLYYKSVATNDAPAKPLQPNKDYKEQLRTSPNGGGVSIKVGKTKDVSGPIAQLEYTLKSPQLYYDLSFVNAQQSNPFVPDGISLTPSDKKCHTIVCRPGDANCKSAYQKPHDDHATVACGDSADYEAVFCIGGGGDGGASSESPGSAGGADATASTSPSQSPEAPQTPGGGGSGGSATGTLTPTA